jgi:hypothetical protein
MYDESSTAVDNDDDNPGFSIALTHDNNLRDDLNDDQCTHENKWDRTKAGSFVDKTLYEHTKIEQNNLRKAFQLTPDTDNPWDRCSTLEGGQTHGDLSFEDKLTASSNDRY